MNRTDIYPVENWMYWSSNAGGIRARWNGEFRAPKKGEYYLSGAEVMAYQAPSDYGKNCKYHIAELVRIKTETIVTVVEVLDSPPSYTR